MSKVNFKISGGFECECKPGFSGSGTFCKKNKKSTTTKPATSTGRPGQGDAVKAQEVRTKVKKENVQSHMVGFGNLKENTDAAINTVRKLLVFLS